VRAVLLVAALLVAGCAADPPPVTVGLYQTRSDTPLDRIEMQVRNSGDIPVTVQRAKLVSTRLTAFPVWDEPVEIPPGAAVDLKVQLPPAVCGTGESDEVELSVDGRQWTLPAQDTLGQLARYQAAQCFRQDVERVGSLRVTGLAGDRLQLEARGDVRLGEFGTTTLFRPADPMAAARGAHVRLLPNRCDAHALADDKQGTYFPLTVTLPDGRSGSYVLAVDERTRAELYALYAKVCRL
jgi:hypothetical protein